MLSNSLTSYQNKYCDLISILFNILKCKIFWELKSITSVILFLLIQLPFHNSFFLQFLFNISFISNNKPFNSLIQISFTEDYICAISFKYTLV